MILVTGAAGNIGGALVAALAEAGQPVRALSRSARPDQFPSEVEIAAGDLNDPAGLRPVLDGVDGLFLLPGYTDMPGVLSQARRSFAQWATAHADAFR